MGLNLQKFLHATQKNDATQYYRFEKWMEFHVDSIVRIYDTSLNDV